jgi:methyl-accepting chemotaxis protein
MADDSKKKDDAVQQAMTQFAEQLGWFLGTVRSKADGLLENEEIVKHVNRIRDGATDLLSRVRQAGDVAKEAAAKASAKVPAKPAAKPAAKAASKTARSGGTVDAPGKRHRKPPPQETVNKRMGEVQGKKAGQKQFKVGKSRGR